MVYFIEQLDVGKQQGIGICLHSPSCLAFNPCFTLCWVSYFFANHVNVYQNYRGRTTRENLRNLSKSTDEDFDWLGLTDSRLELRSRI